MAFTAISASALTQLKLGSVISYVEATDSLNESVDVSAKDDLDWGLLAQVSELVYKVETEEDAFTHFSAETGSYVENKNTSAKLDSFTATCREFTDLMWKLKYRAGEADSNGKRKLFTTNEVSKLVWLRVQKYDAYQTLIATQYMYGELRIDEDITETNKHIRPKIVFEVVASAYNCEILPALATASNESASESSNESASESSNESASESSNESASESSNESVTE